MATVDTTNVLACMFEVDVVLSLGGNTYALPANRAIGIPDTIDEVTVDVATNVLCMTQDNRSRRNKNGSLEVLYFNEIRLSS